VNEPTNHGSLRRAGRLVKRDIRQDRDAGRRQPNAAARSLTALVPALLIFLGGCRAGLAPTSHHVRLAGAQIPVELVASWLHDTREYNFGVEQVGPVYLSQHGFQNLAEGACDIACTDRRLTRREADGLGDLKLQGYRAAFYGFALYVHPDNPLDCIFAKHLKLIFQRKFTDWNQLGTPYEGPIRLVGPEKSTRGGMVLMRQANIWFDTPAWETFETDVEIVDAVAADPYALGFASIGFDQDARYVGLRMRRESPPAFPSLEEIESERYGLAKVIYLYMPAETSPAAQAVLDYLFSEDGRESMESTNVWSIPFDRATVESP